MIIDLAFVIALIFGIYKGFSNSFFDTTLNMFKGIVSIILAMKISYLFTDALDDSTLISQDYLPIVAFLVAFTVVFISFRFMRTLFESLAGGNFDQWFRTVGILAWLFMLSLGFSTFLSWGLNAQMVSYEVLNTSAVYPYVEPIYPIVSCKLSYIWPAFEGMYESFLSVLGDAGNSIKGQCM